MAEEFMTQPTEQATSGASGGDFFSDFQLVDDSGQPLKKESDPTGELQQKPTEQVLQPAQEQKTDEGTGKQEQKPALPKSSFEKRFFKSGEDGKEAFDTDGFVDFMQKRKAPTVARQPYQQQQPQQQAQPQPPKEPENPYVARVKARQEYRKNLQAPADIFHAAFSQARQAGYDENQAWQYARNQWQAKVDEQAALYEAQQEEEWAKKQGESERTKAQAVEFRQGRLNNELAYAKEFGSVDDFREFVLGRNENGQLVGGYANDVLWTMYTRDNPDNPNPTQDQFLAWYDKFGSQPEAMQMLYEVAWARMMARQWPNVVKRIQAGQQQMQQQQKVSKTSKPGTRQSAPIGGESTDDPLGGFMMPTV